MHGQYHCMKNQLVRSNDDQPEVSVQEVHEFVLRNRMPHTPLPMKRKVSWLNCVVNKGTVFLLTKGSRS
jgi:hypothetical protein